MIAPDAKEKVRDYWEAESCSVRYGAGDDIEVFYSVIESARYAAPLSLPD